MAQTKPTTSHTPGPWAVETTVGLRIGQPRGVVRVGTLSIETSLPDARLIAAAPDLLAALQALVERIERDNGWSQRDDGLTSARTAIAKAVQS